MIIFQNHVSRMYCRSFKLCGISNLHIQSHVHTALQRGCPLFIMYLQRPCLNGLTFLIPGIKREIPFELFFIALPWGSPQV